MRSGDFAPTDPFRRRARALVGWLVCAAAIAGGFDLLMASAFAPNPKNGIFLAPGPLLVAHVAVAMIIVNSGRVGALVVFAIVGATFPAWMYPWWGLAEKHELAAWTWLLPDQKLAPAVFPEGWWSRAWLSLRLLAPPSILTGALLSLATRSWIVGAGALVGGALVSVLPTGRGFPSLFLFHAPIALTLGAWGIRVLRSQANGPAPDAEPLAEATAKASALTGSR